MRRIKWLCVAFTVFLLLTVPCVKAAVGDLRYQITGFSINDANKTITFKGWVFIHQTNNFNTIYKLDSNGSDNTSTVVVSNGGQKIKITAYDDNGNYITSRTADGSSEKNYNFTKRMYYRYDNTYNHFIAEYNQENGTPGNMQCDNNNIKSNCYYKDLYFEITFAIDENWYNKNINFTISATNNDYTVKTGRSWTSEEKLHIISKDYGGPNINNNSQIVEIKKNTTTNKVKFLAETATVKNLSWNEIGGYGYPGDIFLIRYYDNNGDSGIGNTEGVGRYFLYSRGKDLCNLPGDKWAGKSCWYGSDKVTSNIIGAWSSWVIPYGDTSFTINVINEKKCPIDNSNSEPLSCNNTQKIVSECDELTVYDGGESAIVSIKQTGTIANLLSPTEIYNGGGIKFGLLYYNRVEFNYVSGSRNVNITDIMNKRVIGYENITLDKIKIGNIDVDSSYIKRECTQKKGNNYVDTICLFHFTPQIVAEDGSIIKDDVDAKYDLGINNKYYLPLDYVPVYRVSASLMNASLLKEQQAKSDGKDNKVWYGNKWNEISLASDGSCDINVYKLGPGSDSGESGGSRIIYKFVYRPIDLNNPFPNRNAGLNWYTWYNGANIDRLKNSYDNLDYSILISNDKINKIKKYNSSTNYFNFDFDKFINETGLKVGGNS